jgi:pilus assembly protein Flp/PilA
MLSDILRKLSQDENGTSAVEYGLICAMIVLVMLSALQGVADTTVTMWIDIARQTLEASRR